MMRKMILHCFAEVLTWVPILTTLAPIFALAFLANTHALQLLAVHTLLLVCKWKSWVGWRDDLVFDFVTESWDRCWKWTWKSNNHPPELVSWRNRRAVAIE